MRRMRREKVRGRGGQSRGEESARVPEPCMPLGKTCVQPHLFGPVPSRRPGRSLGVDLVPFKTCTFDCIHCQLGRTTNLTRKREASVSPQVILGELRRRLAEPERPDFITRSGSGEPTLCLNLGAIIAGIKSITEVPVAVLTNGSLLWDESVRRELMAADLVIPSLDAGDEALYHRINRPCNGLDFDRLVDGLVTFRREFSNFVWLEVFLLSGLNSSEADVRRIAKIARMIKPDKVQLNTVARPPAEEFAMAVPTSQMESLANRFDVETGILEDVGGLQGSGTVSTTRDDLIQLLRRRPCTVEDVAAGLGLNRIEVMKHLNALVESGDLVVLLTNGKRFYQTKP